MRLNRYIRRGFTVAELTVSMAITAIVMTLVMGTVVSQQRGFQSSETGRRAIEGGRDAMLELERSVRRAGFGVDPRYAFDFAYYRCEFLDSANPKTNLPFACRDRNRRAGALWNAGFSDELVFFSRNPNYRIVPNGSTLDGTTNCADTRGCVVGRMWRIKPGSIDAPTRKFTLERLVTGGPTKLQRGQVLLAVCSNSPANYTMMTVDVPVTLTKTNDTDVKVYPATPADPPTTLAPSPYRENAIFNTGGLVDCYGTSAVVFEIDMYRYFIRYDFPRESPQRRPWLMLDRGVNLNDLDSTDPWVRPAGTDPDASRLTSLEPVAANIDDMQVAYIMNPIKGQAAPDAGAFDGTGSNWVLGDANLDPATTTAASEAYEEPNPFVTAPLYRTLATDSARSTPHPANIRAVRIGLVVRGEQRLPGAKGAEYDTAADPFKRVDVLPPLENRGLLIPPSSFSATTDTDYRGIPRSVVQTSVALRNMQSRGMFAF